MIHGGTPSGTCGIIDLAGGSARRHLSAAALAKETGKKVVTTRTYNEGGNMLAGTLPQRSALRCDRAERGAGVGSHLEEKYKANPADVPEFDGADLAKHVGTMTFDATEVSQTVLQLDAAGRIPKRNGNSTSDGPT